MRSVYFETTIPSYLVARLSPDGELAAKQAITRAWWENHRLTCTSIEDSIDELLDDWEAIHGDAG